MTDKNRHVTEYLSYYLSLPHPPQYAVMVNGPWGIGKTYLVKEFLRRQVGDEKKYVYISLYGLTTIEEIDAALLQGAYPALGWQVAKIGAKLGKVLLKRIGLESDLTISDLMQRFIAEAYIFDDLERCDAPINKVLGYMNEFVEHDDAKVIIIANEQEIPNSNAYLSRREKLIGKTLEVQSAFDEAFRHFLSLIDEQQAREVLEQLSAEIASIYHQSELNNLRILQQTMWDFERFYRATASSHRGNSEAVTALVRLLFALSFELKAGRIKLDDLQSRMRPNALPAAAMRDGEPTSALAMAGKRYPEVDLTDQIVSDAVLIDVLVRGIVNSDAIKSCLDKSRFFVAVADEPAWRTVWHWFERTDDEVKTAFNELEGQFLRREFTITGEMLHVFGLRLFLSKIGVLQESFKDVVADCKCYIDDLYTAHHLDGAVDVLSEVRFGGYGGLGIHENDSQEYRELVSYLELKTKQAAKNRYPEQAQVLLREMEQDPDLYLRRLCFTNSPDNSYYQIPILASISPEFFVSTVLKQHPAHQRRIFVAFKARYEHGGLQGHLASERPWLAAVRDQLVEKANSLPPIGRYRLLKILNGILRLRCKDPNTQPLYISYAAVILLRRYFTSASVSRPADAGTVSGGGSPMRSLAG
jgi:KAP family P-loop domain